MLLLLGGCEIPSAIPALGTVPVNQKVLDYLNSVIYLSESALFGYYSYCCFNISPRTWVTFLHDQFNHRELHL